MRSGVINQNPSHHLRGYSKKVCAILPRDAPLSNKSDVRLMNQGRRLERVIRTLVS
jgi:hypothetical protein